MSAAAIIQPINDNNNHQVLALLDNSSSSSDNQEGEEEKNLMMTEEEQKQQILSYLNKSSSPISSFITSSKRVPRLGPFLLLKTLGVGEFGKVKMGRHSETGQTVAVKLVKKENIDSSSQLEKIRMEIDILKTLNHPYIVKLLSVNETNTCIGMVLEYAQGGELFEYIYRQRYLKENEACRLFSQLISSVYYMHQKNIVHRDLKLENILLDRHGNLIVTDFGFANQFTPKTGDLMSTSCGSPVYAAPELVMTGRLYAGTGVDIWSCGIILYAMLCGYLPFDDDIKNPNGDNIGRLYRYIMANKPKYPPHLSHDSKDVIGKMLIPDPSSRCKIETIMAHPWLYKYKSQISKSVEELEAEAQVLKHQLLKGIESKSTTEDDYIEDVCCDEEEGDEHSSSSVCSSVSSSYSFPPSYSNTKDAQDNDDGIINEEEENDDQQQHSSPPTTPIPYSKDINSLSTTIEEFPTTEKLIISSPSRTTSHAGSSTNQQQQSSSKSTNEHVNDDAVTIPVCSSQEQEEVISNKIQQQSNSSSSSSSLLSPPVVVNKKRHTIDAIVTNSTIVNYQQDTNRPAMPVQYSSLRAKLFNSVKRRNNSLTVVKKEEDSIIMRPTKENKNRHSWQNIMHRSTSKENTLPLSPPSSPVSPEHSKSVRLISWLKTKSHSGHHHKKDKDNNNDRITTTTTTTTTSSSSSMGSSSNNNRKLEQNATIPVARPSSSLAPMRSSRAHTPISRTPTVLSLLQQQKQQQRDIDRISVESELRVHAGDMNRSALTSKPPMEVLLEINKILLILGIEVENQGGYKLFCIRRSTTHYHNIEKDEDLMNHLSTSHQPVLSQPIYGHPSLDNGGEIRFSVEICRFENLSGLFSVDIQSLDEETNYEGYQFIGQKLLALLHLGNAIRNTNFSVMLSRDR